MNTSNAKWEQVLQNCNEEAIAAAAAKARNSEFEPLPAGSYLATLEKGDVKISQSDDGEQHVRPWLLFKVTQSIRNPDLEGRTCLWSPYLRPNEDGKCIDGAKLLSMYREIFDEDAPAATKPDGTVLKDEKGQPIPSPLAAFKRILEDVCGGGVIFQITVNASKKDPAKTYVNVGKIVRSAGYANAG